MSLRPYSHVFLKSRLQRHRIKINITDDPFIQLRCEWSAQLTLIHHSPLAIKTRASTGGLVLHGVDLRSSYPATQKACEIHVIITHGTHNRTNQTSTQVKLTFPYRGCYMQCVHPVRGRWKMLNCNRRTPNERNQLETPSSIFTREAGGACNVLWDGRRRLFSLKFAEAISVNQSRLVLVNFWHCDKSSRPN